MSRPDGVIGIVLAGGRSSRMGRNKALLSYRGAPLVDFMVSLLYRAGCDRVIISGDLPGHDCIPDPCSGQGPARALSGLLAGLKRHAGALVVPVDMPLLPEAALRRLTDTGHTNCFADHPLPAFFRLPCEPSDASSVGRLVNDLGGGRLALPRQWQPSMVNLNTPEQWREVTGNEPAYC